MNAGLRFNQKDVSLHMYQDDERISAAINPR